MGFQLQNPFLHPGIGLPLRRVVGATGNVILEPQTTTIMGAPGPGQYTETVGAHDCIELMFAIVFTVQPVSGSLVLQICPTPFVTAADTFANVTVNNPLIYRWNSGQALQGYYRWLNNSPQSATIYCQKRIF